MGSNETATATTGGARVIDVFYGNGRHRAQIVYFFRWQIGPRTRSGIGLRSGGPVDRIRRFSGLSRELWIENFGGSWSRALERKGTCLYVCTDGSAHACAVGDCTCIVPTLGDPRKTCGPRIDRFPSTRPPWQRRQFRELKKLIFSAPRKCPIDLFGPLANRTVLKQLQAAFHISKQNPTLSPNSKKRAGRYLHRSQGVP